jgi:hypothetical protein
MLTKASMTGTSMRGPMTAANAYPEPRPKTATATAMASSKLLLAAVKESVAFLGFAGDGTGCHDSAWSCAAIT